MLDEPTNGLDPAGIHDIRELVARIAESGLTVLVSSHLLVEVQSVCDWLVIIDRDRPPTRAPSTRSSNKAA